MRILHIAPTKDQRSGIARYARDYRSALVQSGHSVINLAEELRARSGTFEETSLSETIARCHELSNDALLRSIDLIHLEVGTELVPEFFAARVLAQSTDLPLVVTIHDAPYTVKNLHPYINLTRATSLPARAVRKAMNRTIGRWYEHSVIERASVVPVLTQRGQAALQRRFPGVSVRLLRHVAPVDCPPDRVDWWNESRSLRLLFVGFLFKSKGLPILIAALGQLQKDSRYRGRFDLTVCGGAPASEKGNPYLDALRRSINQHGLEDVVRLAGFVTDETLVQELTRSDVMVLPYLPSKEIQSSAPLIQAMSYSLVPVVTTARSMGEIVKDDENGRVVPSGDVDALATALKDLLDSPAVVRRLALAARETMQREHSWKAIGREATAMYDAMIKGR